MTVYDIEQEVDARAERAGIDPSLVRAALIGVVAVGVTGAVLAALTLWTLFTGGVHRSWVDQYGRTCTTTVQGLSVSTDCDYPPTEDRVAQWLQNLSEGGN